MNAGEWMPLPGHPLDGLEARDREWRERVRASVVVPGGATPLWDGKPGVDPMTGEPILRGLEPEG